MSNNTQPTHVSPYAAAKLVNAALDEAGIKRIPPQMMYNYSYAKVTAGKKPLIACDREKGGIEVKDLQRWLKAYIEKKTPATETTETVEA